MKKNILNKRIIKFGYIASLILFTNSLTFVLADQIQHKTQINNNINSEISSDIKKDINTNDKKKTTFLIDPDEVKNIDNIVIVAHPDDETLWAGSYITKEKCLVLCITNGDNLIRRNEFFDVMEVTDNYGIMLNYPDNPKKVKSTWKNEKKDILNDIQYLINYKSWKRIITHNPEGEYGHIQHRFTSMLVTNVCVKNGIENRLFYFEKYMNKNKVNAFQATIGNDQIEYKHSLMQKYTSQINAYNKFKHMMSYEMLIPYDEWYFG